MLRILFLSFLMIFNFSKSRSQDLSITLNPLFQKHQTVDGFGGGLKRRTQFIVGLDKSLQDQLYQKAFVELEINMLRFFIHHSISSSKEDFDNNIYNWTYYETHPDYAISGTNKKGVAEVVNEAITRSRNAGIGIDYIIGNLNSAPGWMKENGSHKRNTSSESVHTNRLINSDEYRNYFSQMIIKFLNAMKSEFGITVTDVSLTNEPDFKNTYESMNETPDRLIKIIPNLKQKLNQSSALGNVRIISPEGSGVSPTNGNSNNPQNNRLDINSTLSYVQNMFNDDETLNAIDVVATHTYFHNNFTSNWAGLKNVSQSKPIWVTESGNLKSEDTGMSDAVQYVKWITRGFNEGGMTAYMTHLLIEEHDEDDDEPGNDSSALVLWEIDSNGNNVILLPKRYYVYKHFSTLSGKNYVRISNESSGNSNNFLFSSFISPQDDEIVLHVFNQSSSSKTLALSIPSNTQSIKHHVTDSSNNFTSSSLSTSDTNVTLSSMSMNSFVLGFKEIVDSDSDGVSDSNDNCPNTPQGTRVDVNGCPVFELPLNNFKVEVGSATCIGNSDGVINLSVEDASYDYSVTVTGQSDLSITGTSTTASVTGLAKGTYEVCFKVVGQDGYEQCFEVVVGEPKPLSAFIDVDSNSGRMSVTMGGSSMYYVNINGVNTRVDGDTFETELSTGLSIITISTDLECQGVVKQEVFISEKIHYYPNPTLRNVNVHVGGEDASVRVSVFSEKGDLIYTRDQSIEQGSRKIHIDLTNQITGTYIVTLESKTVRQSFKIIRE